MPGLWVKVGLVMDVSQQQCSGLDDTEAHQQSELVTGLYKRSLLVS